MLRNIKSEYQAKYSRRLWDKSTRLNYFQLKDDRKARLWRSTNHAPLHWNHEIDEEITEIQQPVCSCTMGLNFVRSTSTQTKSKCICRKASCPPKPDKRPKSASSIRSIPKNVESSDTKKKIGSKIKPGTPPPSTRDAWGSQAQSKPPPRASSRSTIHSELQVEQGNSCKCNDEACVARRCCQAWVNAARSTSRSSSILKGHQKRFKINELERSSPTNHSVDENGESRKRQKSRPPTPYQQSGVHNRSSSACRNRPQSAPPSAGKKPDSTKPPFAMYGNPPGPGTRKTYNVKPKSKEIYPSALKAKNDRARLGYWRDAMEKSGNVVKKVYKSSQETTLPLTNLPKDTTAWITEYQGNYKAWN